MRKVALLIETARSYGRGLLRGVRDYVSAHEPWSVDLELRALESQAPAWLNGWRGDGILSRTSSPEMADAIHAVGVPVVELRASRSRYDFPFVGIDNAAIAEMVAQHFFDRGFRRFGVYGLATEAYFEQREARFVKIVRDAGCEVSVLDAIAARNLPGAWEAHQQRLTRWLTTLPKPVGIMACTDQLGFWLLDACMRAAIAVPEQVAVVGAENEQTLCEVASPPLSSVEFPARTVGYRAAERLDRLMNGETAGEPLQLIPPLQIVTRRSSDAIATADLTAAAALRFIREHACRGISVDDVVQHLNISRSSLERKLRTLLGRAPSDEINRIRMDEARRLLSQTEVSVATVAQRTGFASVQYFCAAFRRANQCTAGEYRAEFRK